MKLSKRLEAVASFVWPSGRIIDVGANHGELCVFFALQDSGRKIIATDCNPKSLWAAEHNIKKYRLDTVIDVVVTDGLCGIDIYDTDNIIIAGMGTRTIKTILTEDVLEKGKHFIIQSNNYLYELRTYMVTHGFIIHNEKVIMDYHKYYVVIEFVKGHAEYTMEELKYGPCLIRQKERAYFDYLYTEQVQLLNKIPKEQIERFTKQKDEVDMIKKIREAL